MDKSASLKIKFCFPEKCSLFLWQFLFGGCMATARRIKDAEKIRTIFKTEKNLGNRFRIFNLD